MSQDRNLLFGVFAVQLRKITPTQLTDVAGAWAMDPSRDLGEILVENDAIDKRDCELIRRLVREAVNAHDGDEEATLVSFGGAEQVHDSFGGSIRYTAIREIETVEMQRTPPESEEIGVEESPGRYTRSSEWARGGMGRVLLVHDEHLGRDIALKELLPDLALPSESTPVRKSIPIIARFLQEARITGQLEHPAIVPVYELGRRRDGSIYYTMKLVRGKTLAQAIREAESLEERLKLLPHFVDLCQAIAYAHSRGVIHRDIKPGNVMVGEFGETVVLDWGLAKAKNTKDVHADEFAETLHVINVGDRVDFELTARGHPIGTPAFMSPEQARGDIEAIDERSDVYSLGAVLFSLISGQAPFEGQSSAEVLSQVLSTTQPNPRLVEPKAPRELCSIINRAMAKNPENRFPGAKEIVDDVARFTSGDIVRSHKYAPVERAGRLLRRNARTALTTAASLAAISIVTIGYSINLSRVNEELRIVVEEAELSRDLAAGLGTNTNGFNKLHTRIADRMRARHGEIDELKERQLVGENNRGYLRVLRTNDVSDSDERLLEFENFFRRELYNSIANENGTSLEVIEKTFAEKRMERAKPGRIFQLPQSERDMPAFVVPSSGLVPGDWVSKVSDGRWQRQSAPGTGLP